MVGVNERVFDSSVELKVNALLKVRPELFNEWDFEKNGEIGLDVYTVSKYSKSIVNWICQKCGSHYEERIYNRGRANDCPYCLGKKVNQTNCLSTRNVSLTSEWHPTLNGELTPDDVYYQHKNKAWWKCPKCGSDYDSSIYGRHAQGYNCPYCAGQKVNHTNSLAVLRPDLASQWHLTKNKLTSHDVPIGSGSKVWWIGECGHEFLSPIRERTNRGASCPYCSNSNKKLLVGFNDMRTTNPELASLLADSKDGFRFTQNSSKKVDWKCSTCNQIIKNKCIGTVKNQGLACKNCSDGISYPEKVMFSLLKVLEIDFDSQKIFSWARVKKYDFFVPSINLIIETHGNQHYEESNFSTYGSRTLEEEQENDKAKLHLSKINRIDNYVVIDCRYSNFDYIKKNIMNSDLKIIFNLESVNWDIVNLNSQKSFNFEMLRLWKEDNCSLNEISDILKIGNATISRVLRNFESLGLCVYDGNRGRKRTAKEKTRKVYQFNKNLDIVKIWSSAKDIEESLNIDTKFIYATVGGKQKTSHGFIWRYEKDIIGWSVPINK